MAIGGEARLYDDHLPMGEARRFSYASTWLKSTTDHTV